MKVTFTPKEYRQLLELVHLGMWTVTGYQGDDTPAAKRYHTFDQRLMQMAEGFGCGEFVEARPDGSLQPSAKLAEDEKVRDLQSEFQNDVFWHELVQRLADRELGGESARRAVATPGLEPPPTSDDILKGLEDRYWKEFEKNDLANVVVLRGGRG